MTVSCLRAFQIASLDGKQHSACALRNVWRQRDDFFGTKCEALLRFLICAVVLGSSRIDAHLISIVPSWCVMIWQS